jgi:hypothetical protein
LTWSAACSACAAVILVHATYGAAAAAIDADDGPSQGPAVSATSSDWYELAAECIVAASPSQAAVAANIGPEPGPAYIRAELISGGSSAKSMSLPPIDLVGRRGVDRH